MYKRSSWKLPFINPLVYKNNFKKKTVISFRLRNLLVSKACVNKKFKIFNGCKSPAKIFNNINIGHKLGEFSFTKRCESTLHMKKKLKKKIRKK